MNRVSEQGGNAADNKPAEELVAAMSRMQDGKLSFANFRDELANCLYLDFRQASSIEAWLLNMELCGDLPSHLYRVLESDIQRICAEDVPTLIDTSSMLLKRKASEAEKPIKPKERPTVAKPPTDMAARRRPKNVKTAPENKGAKRSIKVGDLLCGRYEIVALVDGGNMSQVFRARDSSAKDRSEANCAIKALAPAMTKNGRALRALQDEYKKGAMFDHPNVVKYRTIERDGSLIFIVMEWLPGETLAQYLGDRTGVAQSLNWSRHILEQISSALEAVHAEGLVHADIKPGNVMLLPDGQLKLFDFGVARVYGEKRATHTGFDAGVLGAATPAYASAALLAGKVTTPIDDWYSVACIAYRLFSGARVFGRESALEAKNNGRTPKRIESLTNAQWHALQTYLQFDGNEQIDSFEQMLSTLRTIDLDEGNLFDQRQFFWWSAIAALAVLAAFAFWRQQPGSQEIVLENTANSAVDQAMEPVTQPDETSEVERESVAAVVEQASDSVVGSAAEISEPVGSSTNEIESSTDIPENVAAQARPYEPISDRLHAQLAIGDEPLREANYTRRSTDGAFEVQLGLPAGITQPSLVRAFLAPIDAPDESHVLRLETTSAVVVDPNGGAAIKLRPFENPGLEPHRSYRLWISDADDLASIRAALSLKILNPALMRMETESSTNTVGFLTPEVQVNERDMAIEVSVLRLRPDQQSFVARFVVQALSANADEDFFAPLATSVTFGPGESEAKIILPLLNDSIVEVAESLMIELYGVTSGDLLSSVKVVINDDDYN